jgi:hypothetical protein
MGELDDKEMVASCLEKALAAYDRANSNNPDRWPLGEHEAFTANMTEANYWLLTAIFFRIGQIAKLR